MIQLFQQQQKNQFVFYPKENDHHCFTTTTEFNDRILLFIYF